MSCYCKCPVALHHGAAGWSAVCDCGIPSDTHFLILGIIVIADNMPMDLCYRCYNKRFITYFLMRIILKYRDTKR